MIMKLSIQSKGAGLSGSPVKEKALQSADSMILKQVKADLQKNKHGKKHLAGMFLQLNNCKLKDFLTLLKTFPS